MAKVVATRVLMTTVLGLLLTGAAWAGNVGTVDLLDGAVTTAKIADGAVTDGKISGVISGAKLGSHGHAGSDLLDASVSTAKLAPGAVTDAIISGVISGAKLGSHAHAGSDLLDASVSTAKLAPGAVTDEKIAGKISTSKLLVGTAAGTVAAGDHTHSVFPYANLVTVAKSGGDYTSLSQALNAINPSAEAPCLIKILPGTYLEDNLLLKDHVRIEGSGPNATILKKGGVANYMMYTPAAVDCELADLTIRAEDLPAGSSFALINLYTGTGETSHLVLRDVAIEITGAGYAAAYAMTVLNTTLELLDSKIEIDVPDSGNAIGINSHASDIVIDSSRIFTRRVNYHSNDQLSIGLMVMGGTVRVVNSELVAVNSEQTNPYDATILAGGCSGGCGPTPEIRLFGSTVSGNKALQTTQTNGVGGLIFAAGSQIDGAINGTPISSGTVKLVNCFDAAFAPIANR